MAGRGHGSSSFFGEDRTEAETDPADSRESRLVKPRTACVVLEAGNEIEIGLEPPLSLKLCRDRLSVGDIVMFDGDVPHRGVAADDLVAMHGYLDVLHVQRERDPHKLGAFISVQGYQF